MFNWPKSTVDCIQSYCIRCNVAAVHVGDWGCHIPERNLLFYKQTTPREIHDAFEHLPNRRPTVAFCDGSGTTSEKTAGIGVVIYTAGENPIYIAENIGLGTNNVAELRAIWRALRAFPDVGKKLVVQSDSEYAIGSLTKPWNATANKDLIHSMRRDLELREGRVIFKHVDGHTGIEGQEIADRLANIGRKLVTQVSL